MAYFRKLRLFLATSFSPFLLRISIGFMLAAIFCYFFVDFPLIEAIASLSKTFRFFFKVISMLIFPPFYLLIWIGAFIWARFISTNKQWTLPFFEIATAQAFSVAFVRIFKIVIGRTRPKSFLSKDLTEFAFFNSSHHFHSLPSGHIMAAFTLAASITLIFPRLRYCSMILAFLFSLSRVYLLNHFPSDLFATAAMAIVIAQTIHIMLQKVIDVNYGTSCNERFFTFRNR